MKKSDEKKMDKALEKLLKRASDPAVPQGAEGRLMSVIRGTEQHSNVVHFQPRTQSRNWLIGLPLAASLLLGIYLGSGDAIDGYLPDSIMGVTVAGATDADVSSGFDDVEEYADGELT
jgi:hypothetical protein